MLRLEKVHYCLMQGMTETQIAKDLNISRSTVGRTKKSLRKQTSDWIDSLSKDSGYLLEHKLAVDRINGLIYELYQLLGKATKISEKIQIINSIMQHQKDILEILNNTPMLESFHRFVQENLIDKRLQQIKSKSSDSSIPVISIDALPPGTDMSTTYPEPSKK